MLRLDYRVLSLLHSEAQKPSLVIGRHAVKMFKLSAVWSEQKGLLVCVCVCTAVCSSLALTHSTNDSTNHSLQFRLLCFSLALFDPLLLISVAMSWLTRYLLSLSVSGSLNLWSTLTISPSLLRHAAAHQQPGHGGVQPGHGGSL